MRRLSGLTLALAGLALPSTALAEVTLIDGSGLEFEILDSITQITWTWSTGSSQSFNYASGAAGEAEYTQAVPSTTTSGASYSTTLGDMFDGYSGIEIDGAGYFNIGPATQACDNREVVFSAVAYGDWEVQRRVFVPDDDSFARWLTFVTNNGSESASMTLTMHSNMGSDGETVVLGSSSGDTTWTDADEWFATGGDYDDPRATHVLMNGGGTVAVSDTRIEGDDNLIWSYNVTLDAGQTGVIMNLVSGQLTNDAAVSRGPELVPLGPSATRCMTQAEFDQLLNFGVDCTELDDGECTTGYWNPEAAQCEAQTDPECGGEDSGDDTGASGDDTGIGDKDEGCGCSSTPSPTSGGLAAIFLLGLVGLRRRR